MLPQMAPPVRHPPSKIQHSCKVPSKSERKCNDKYDIMFTILKEKGVIDEEDYNSKKEEILKTI